MNLQYLLSGKNFVIKDMRSLAVSITQSTRYSLNHVLENVNTVLGQTTAQLALQVLKKIVVPNCFD